MDAIDESAARHLEDLAAEIRAGRRIATRLVVDDDVERCRLAVTWKINRAAPAAEQVPVAPTAAGDVCACGGRVVGVSDGLICRSCGARP